VAKSAQYRRLSLCVIFASGKEDLRELRRNFRRVEKMRGASLLLAANALGSLAL
jgi:hypothetical protein